MGSKTEITCDSCAKDLTSTGNCVDYYLVLASANKQLRGGFVTAMMMYPAINQDHFFCGLACLDRWTARRQYVDGLFAAWWERWRDEQGTKHEGCIVSYPTPSDEVEKARNAEFEKMAAEKFPILVRNARTA